MRRRLTVMVPQALMGLVDDVAKRYLGVGRNAFFCLGAMLLIARLSGTMDRKKRLDLLRELESVWQTIVDEARKAA